MRGMMVCALLGSALLAGNAEASETATSTASLVPPSLLHETPPIYPAQAQKERVEGIVTLEIDIDETGAVSEARVVRGPGAGLNEAAQRAARKLRFSPAMEDGVPIAVTVGYRYRFVSPKAPPGRPAARVRTSTVVQSAPAHAVADNPEAAFTVVIEGKKLPRSAADWTFELGVTHAAPFSAGSGAELLRKAPGVYISQHSGQGKGHQIFLRGFDAVHGQDIALSAAGIPINEVSNIHGQGYTDLHFLIPEAILRMRVLEGAYDPRQGDFAVAGSIDFDLGLSRRGLLGRVSAGSFGLVRGLAAWGPEGESEETFVAAEFARSNGFGPQRAWNRGSAIAQWVLPLLPSVDLRMLASTYAGRYDAAGVVRLSDFDAGRQGFFDAALSGQGGSSIKHQGLLEVRYRGDGSEAALSMYLTYRDLRLRQNFTGFLKGPQGDLSEQLHRAVTAGGKAHYQKRLFADRLRLELGASWRFDDIDQSQTDLRQVDLQGLETTEDNALKITDLGMYVDANLVITDRLSARAGLRVEALSFVIDERLAQRARREAFGFELLPKATIDYQAMDALRLFLSYGKGFRSPQAVSLGQGERAPFTSVHSGELGGRFDLGPLLKGTVAGFVTYVEEDLLFDHASGRNVVDGETVRGGAQLLLESRLFEFVHATFSGTYTYAVKPESGERVSFVPPIVLRLDVDGHRHVGTWFDESLGVFAAAGVTFLGPRPLPFSEQTSPVFVLNLAAGVEWSHFALSVEVENLLNTRWRDAEFVYTSDFNPGGGTSAVPARHFSAGRPLTAQATLTVNY